MMSILFTAVRLPLTPEEERDRRLREINSHANDIDSTVKDLRSKSITKEEACANIDYICTKIRGWPAAYHSQTPIPFSDPIETYRTKYHVCTELKTLAVGLRLSDEWAAFNAELTASRAIHILSEEYMRILAYYSYLGEATNEASR
jgi:hypothetical protein